MTRYYPPPKDGDGRVKHKHSGLNGLGRSREYEAWQGAKKRCYQIRSRYFKDYGGRGITVCDEWKNDFLAFLKYMGPRPSSLHTLERINNDGNYEPGNCRWATRAEQTRNRRSNHLVTIGGETKCLTVWARQLNMCHKKLAYRLKRGLPIAEYLVAEFGGLVSRKRVKS